MACNCRGGATCCMRANDFPPVSYVYTPFTYINIKPKGKKRKNIKASIPTGTRADLQNRF